MIYDLWYSPIERASGSRELIQVEDVEFIVSTQVVTFYDNFLI